MTNPKLLHPADKLYQSHDLHKLFNTAAICTKKNFIRPRLRVYAQCFKINTRSKNRSTNSEHSNKVNSKTPGTGGHECTECKSRVLREIFLLAFVLYSRPATGKVRQKALPKVERAINV